MQAVFGDHPFDAARADDPSALAQLLGDHVRRGVAVEETVPDHLPDDLVRAPVVRLGAAFLAPQSKRTVLLIGGTELEVTLFAVAEFLGGPQSSPALTLAFNEHQQFAGDLVVFAHVQAAGRPDPCVTLHLELCHPGILHEGKSVSGSAHAEHRKPSLSEAAKKVQSNMAKKWVIP